MALLSPCRGCKQDVGGVVCMHPPAGLCHRGQGAHPHQVIDDRRTGEHPSSPRHPAIASLAQQLDRFHPAEDLFHALAFPLTRGLTRMASRPAIDCTRPTRGILRHMRGHSQLTQLMDKVAGVRVPVSPQGDPLLPGNRFGHRQSRVALGRAGYLGHARIDHQAVPILHEHTPQITQLGLLPCGLFVQASRRIDRRVMGGVRAPLAAESEKGDPLEHS